MPPKKRPPAPVDRPLSKAYLRGFSTWSTVASPDMSDPNSLREAQNILVTREGGAKVRPGMRSLLRKKATLPLVGSHELFYTNDGDKAYLVAVRESTGKVGFRVITYLEDDPEVAVLRTLPEAGFDLLNNVASVEFESTTTYVRYLQIDNKVFALSNAPEPMIMFWVGEEKKAKRLSGIDRPTWDLEDRGVVVHPEAAWITDARVSATRINRCLNPSFAHNTSSWRAIWNAKISRDTSQGIIGTSSMAIQSLPARTNFCHEPLHNVVSTGVGNWSYTHAAGRVSVSPTGTGMRVHLLSDNASAFGSGYSDLFHVPTTANKRYVISFDLGASANLDAWQIRVKFFNAAKESMGLSTPVRTLYETNPGRKVSSDFPLPDGCHYVKLIVSGSPRVTGVTSYFDMSNVCMSEADATDAGLALDGDDTGDYFWEGTPNASRSVYHPPQDVGARHVYVPGSGDAHIGSAYVRTDPGGHTVNIRVHAKDAAGNETYTNLADTSTTGFTRFNSGPWTMASATEVDVEVIVRQLARGETAHVDGVLLERASTVGLFFHGSYPAPSSTLRQRWEGANNNSQSRSETFANNQNPTPESKTVNTLISSTSGNNKYNFGFFYTISNELGESKPSRVTTVKTQRQWSSWKWETANGSGEPSGTSTTVPSLCADQLVVTIPQDVFNEAMAAGATKWDAYFYTWGPNEVTPVTAIHFAEIPLDENSVYGIHSWARLTPEQKAYSERTPLIPLENARIDATSPTLGAQGLVANDRIILVGSPNDPAKISWSGGQLGDFHNFSPSVGGGSKQLTSGNLYLTAAVKLWQNPQSVDTLTVLNLGEDGRSNAYYMQPATITSLSESIQVMGFEQTTGMEGTCSPYGCEVVNNALYHPLEQHVIKSTANNYNLTHRTVSDEIANMWQMLQDTHHIVSSHLDGRIYYLVNNPHGALLEDGCWGNEIWVFDAMAENPSWSRWLVQGISLRAMTYVNKVVMSVVRPDGIFMFDPRRTMDEVYVENDTTVSLVPIPWYLETNTQGANRAHDAWSNLQQTNVSFGGFEGHLRYGIRGKDVNGMDIDLEKRVVSSRPPLDIPDTDIEIDNFIYPKDTEDYFLIRKIMKEWVFYAGSINDQSTGRWTFVNAAPANVLTDPALWLLGGYGYSRDHPAPTTANGKMVFTWNAAPTENPLNSAFRGVVIPAKPGTKYTVKMRVEAAAGAARWRVTVGWNDSSNWVTPTGDAQSAIEATWTTTTPETDNPDLWWGIEVNGGADWSSAGTHTITRFEILEHVEEGEPTLPRYSSGQVNFVQYRYTPATVNVGYEYGSVETFEYGNRESIEATTESGTPMPYLSMEADR